jgi:hypothetical protein
LKVAGQAFAIAKGTIEIRGGARQPQEFYTSKHDRMAQKPDEPLTVVEPRYRAATGLPPTDSRTNDTELTRRI